MAWQRKIPFGYQMQSGVIQLHHQEAETIRAIFTQYLAGASYLTIAESLTEHGPRYHEHTPEWNKHMVKRILENEIYLGSGQYPQIIPEEDFLAVHLRKKERNTYKPCPHCVEPVRKKLVCGLCGEKITRSARSHGRARWCCQNPECGGAISITDERLRQLVNEQLQVLDQNPELLADRPAEPSEPSSDLRRIQNELNLAFNRGNESPQFIKTLILAEAAERYATLSDPTPAHELEQLWGRVQADPTDEALFNDLLSVAVRAVHLAPDKSIRLELINGRFFESEDKIS